ncbi:MAG: hypothetical protein ACOCQH_03430 [Halanaerobiales bacterium]
MGIFEKVKNIFKNRSTEGENREERAVQDSSNKDFISAKEGAETGELEKLLQKEYELKMQKKYQACLDLWEGYVEENPKLVHLGRVRRAKIHILQEDKERAEGELLTFIDWYTSQGKINYQGNYFAIFISVLQDLGYLHGRWKDKKEYLANLSGEDIKLQRDKTMARIKKGLEILEERDCWTQALEQIKENIDLIR